jgi:hypothetical protein
MVVGTVTTGGSTQVCRRGPHLCDERTGVLSLVVTVGQHQTNQTHLSSRLRNQTQSRSYKMRIHPQETIESKWAKFQPRGSDL